MPPKASLMVRSPDARTTRESELQALGPIFGSIAISAKCAGYAHHCASCAQPRLVPAFRPGIPV